MKLSLSYQNRVLIISSIWKNYWWISWYLKIQFKLKKKLHATKPKKFQDAKSSKSYVSCNKNKNCILKIPKNYENHLVFMILKNKNLVENS
jgi:hypothetical protein